jgi:queuine tRNA-ribosyltransferase
VSRAAKTQRAAPDGLRAAGATPGRGLVSSAAVPGLDIHFELLHVDRSGARRARFATAHGPVDTPAFMPVGTQGAVKAATPEQVAETGAQVVLANTYHLAREDVRAMVRRAGGLHRVMAWPHSILTDSGGFQVFSLPNTEVDDAGVSFTDKATGARTRLEAEGSMEIQRDLGADIVMAFDECVEKGAPRRYVERSVARTTRWAKRCVAVPLAPHQLRFGIVQGGLFEDLRARSAAEICALPFDGFAIGGVSVGEGFESMVRVVRLTAPLLPEMQPRYLMGVGLPEDLLAAIECGMDMFDCVIPTRYARGGTLFARTGRVRVTDKRYRKDMFPIDTACRCYTCARYSRMVLRHLYWAREPLFETLATIHNLTFYQDLMREARAAIERGEFAAFHREWLARYKRSRDPGDTPDDA